MATRLPSATPNWPSRCGLRDDAGQASAHASAIRSPPPCPRLVTTSHCSCTACAKAIGHGGAVPRLTTATRPRATDRCSKPTSAGRRCTCATTPVSVTDKRRPSLNLSPTSSARVAGARQDDCVHRALDGWACRAQGLPRRRPGWTRLDEPRSTRGLPRYAAPRRTTRPGSRANSAAVVTNRRHTTTRQGARRPQRRHQGP